MRILVTGGTGFIGRHLTRTLIQRGHQLSILGRPQTDRQKLLPPEAELIEADLLDETSYKQIPFSSYDALAHLAWSHLHDYRDKIHLETLLPAHMQFLKSAIKGGISQLFVTGTCFEYGLQEGCLSEQVSSAPVLPYATAKDRLRSQLEILTKDNDCILQWGRLFYLYGEGQSPKSLMAQLDSAIGRGEPAFNMSAGEQLRDYLPVEQVARKIVQVLECQRLTGIVNICSGKPVAIKELVNKHLQKRGATIELNLGHYPYPDYEPMAYWGNESKLKNSVLDSSLSPLENNHV